VHKRWNVLVVALGIAALASGSAALADHGGGKHGKHGKGATKVFTLDPSTHGNPEGVATRGGGKSSSSARPATAPSTAAPSGTRP
jgi:hypothetical protein